MVGDGDGRIGEAFVVAGMDTETFLIATREDSGNQSLDTYSPNSPLGAALLNAKVGDTREYSVPSGAQVKVTLVSAEPYHG